MDNSIDGAGAIVKKMLGTTEIKSEPVVEALSEEAELQVKAEDNSSLEVKLAILSYLYILPC